MSKPKPVKAWARYDASGEVWADTENSHMGDRVEVMIAPTATHAVVELAKLHRLANIDPRLRAIVEDLGIKIPKPKPRRCRTCKGEGSLTVAGRDGIPCWVCRPAKKGKR
jgi:hypothetical protein